MLATVFGPTHERTAVFSLVAAVLYVLAAAAPGAVGRQTGGPIGLVALGLASGCCQPGRTRSDSKRCRRGAPGLR
jgi:hypothetical protein